MCGNQIMLLKNKIILITKQIKVKKYYKLYDLLHETNNNIVFINKILKTLQGNYIHFLKRKIKIIIASFPMMIIVMITLSYKTFLLKKIILNKA